MSKPLNPVGLNLLFYDAHTHTHWLDKPVSDDTLQKLYDLMKWACHQYEL